eukprot:5258729-Pyramimonas_sp.AAC.2
MMPRARLHHAGGTYRWMSRRSCGGWKRCVPRLPSQRPPMSHPPHRRLGCAEGVHNAKVVHSRM